MARRTRRSRVCGRSAAQATASSSPANGAGRWPRGRATAAAAFACKARPWRPSHGCARGPSANASTSCCRSLSGRVSCAMPSVGRGRPPGSPSAAAPTSCCCRRSTRPAPSSGPPAAAWRFRPPAPPTRSRRPAWPPRRSGSRAWSSRASVMRGTGRGFCRISGRPMWRGRRTWTPPSRCAARARTGRSFKASLRDRAKGCSPCATGARSRRGSPTSGSGTSAPPAPEAAPRSL